MAAFALIVEAVNTVDGGALVVASQQKEVLREFNLVCKEQTHRLKGLLSSVDIVSHEEVVGIWGKPAILE